MKDSLKITYEENPSQDALELISDGICAEARMKRGLGKGELFCFLLKDGDDKVMGGIHGDIYYGGMYIAELWVEGSHRGEGHGTALILKAEELASAKNCPFITVNTMDFEARPFYEKLGYAVEFERSGFMKSSVMYFLRKNLV